MFDESFKPPSTPDISPNPGINLIDGGETQVIFDRSFLKQDRITFTLKTVLNFYIVYEINLWPLNLDSQIVLLNCLFGAIKLNKNAFNHSGYVIGFDKCRTFTFSDNCGSGKNVIIFGVDNSSSVHADNRKKCTLFLGKGPRKEFDHTNLISKTEFSIDFSEQQK